MLLLLIFVVIGFAAADTSLAAPLVACSGTDCDLCTLVDTIDNVIDFLVRMSVILATLLLAIAGFKLVFSRGNPSALAKAKEYLINICIGVLIMLAGWTLVDTLMKLLISNQTAAQYGPWNQIDAKYCGSMRAAGTPDEQLPDIKMHENEIEMDEPQTPVNPYGGQSTYGPRPVVPADPTADGQFTYQSGISAQRAHASASLNNMLNCMANKLPASVGQISSISDSSIVNGSKTFAECVKGGCAHVAGSRHYGGTACTGKSYAVDFGDQQNVATLCKAANSCGAVNSCSVHNGNHVHLDLPLSC